MTPDSSHQATGPRPWRHVGATTSSPDGTGVQGLPLVGGHHSVGPASQPRRDGLERLREGEAGLA